MLGDHFLGLYEKAMPPTLSWEERLKTARDLGFDFVEISIDETDERMERLDWNSAERKQFADTIRQSGIRIPSLCLSCHRRYPFGSALPDNRMMAKRLMEKAIRFCSDLGIRVIQLAGYDVYYEPSTPESLQLFQEGLSHAVETAAKYQVMLAMEIMDTRLMSSITRYKTYKEQLPSPWFQLYPDIGNLSAWGNSIEDELTIGIHDIVGIHLKDTLAVTENFSGKFKNVPFGDGCVDFPFAFRTLEKLHYHGPYMMEMWYDPNSDWRSIISQAKRWMDHAYQKGTLLQ